MKWQIQHRTQYSYAAPARESFNDVRLKPPSDEYQTLESFSLVTNPAAGTAIHALSDEAIHQVADHAVPEVATIVRGVIAAL